MENKDYSKYSYFRSKAKNYGLIMKPDRKKIVDGEVDFTPGIRIVFKNGMLRLDKENETDQVMIDFIHKKIETEKDFPQERKTIWEEFKPEKTYTESEVKIMMEKFEKLKEATPEKRAELENEIKKELKMDEVKEEEEKKNIFGFKKK